MAQLFIKQAKQYSVGRPSYPQELFNFIASKTLSHDLAWDVGTGAAKLPNLQATKHKIPMHFLSMSMAELQDNIGSESSFDLVTIAQAMHWFDLPTFYQQVKWVLKKPNGVIAAWCYTVPEVNPTVDSLFNRFYTIDAVDGLEHNGPFRFSSEKVMDLESYFTYLRSWSAYQTAKEKGVELLTENVLEDFKRAWNEDGKFQKTVSFPIYLRIGKVGASS
ncbi:UNVERIFIED_CONTAM: putative methyltransferase DDB [Sesamum latifolium]|uniref:Methyltransferase DDB n=1 Tax=Sesamum latifolium TaxID=2727402 RepID=A0AAW2VGM9_9LAMI